MIKREKYLKNIRGFYDQDLIKVITGQDVEPRVERGNDAHADGHDNGDGVHEDALEVALEDLEGGSHVESPEGRALVPPLLGGGPLSMSVAESRPRNMSS